MTNWDDSLMSFLRCNGLDERCEADGDELVTNFKEGRGSFTSILSRYNPLLLEKSKRWVEGYTHDELYQELAFKMFKCCDLWNPVKRVKFTTYLYTSLDNHLNFLIRKASTHKRFADLISISYETLIIDPTEEEHESTRFKDEPSFEEPGFYFCEILELTNLTERERICVEMIYEGRRSYEIAERLGVSRSGVADIIKRLKPKLEFMIN